MICVSFGASAIYLTCGQQIEFGATSTIPQPLYAARRPSSAAECGSMRVKVGKESVVDQKVAMQLIDIAAITDIARLWLIT